MLDWRLIWFADLGVAAVVAAVVGLALRMALNAAVGLIAAVIVFGVGVLIATRLAFAYRDLPEEPALEPATERLQNDAIGMLVGVLAIVMGSGSWFSGIAYLPGDVRGEPWFGSAFGIVVTIGGLFFFLVFSIRLVQGLRARRK